WTGQALFQPCLGCDEIRGVKTLAERSVDFSELRAILAGISFQRTEVIHAHAKFELKGFCFLCARDLEALAQISLGLIQIAVRSQISFSEQAVDFSRIKAFGILFIEPRLRLIQKSRRVLITLIPDACIGEQSQNIGVIQ